MGHKESCNFRHKTDIIKCISYYDLYPDFGQGGVPVVRGLYQFFASALKIKSSLLQLSG